MGSLEQMESFDDCAGIRNVLRKLATDKREWAGIPLPLDGEDLVVEPSYPFADAITTAVKVVPEKMDLRNQFWSHRYRCDIFVWNEGGKVVWGAMPNHRLTYDLHTMGCSAAWGVEQESNALQLLATLVRHQTFKKYLLTGMFLETSKRSGITYMFRRLRPTVALTHSNGSPSILCALCMHPIAYYAGSWAGAMCPTDDVIAHLMLMRGDEKMFWRRCTQHQQYRPEAGL